jgi:hypothetical protein
MKCLAIIMADKAVHGLVSKLVMLKSKLYVEIYNIIWLCVIGGKDGRPACISVVYHRFAC